MWDQWYLEYEGVVSSGTVHSGLEFGVCGSRFLGANLASWTFGSTEYRHFLREAIEPEGCHPAWNKYGEGRNSSVRQANPMLDKLHRHGLLARPVRQREEPPELPGVPQ